MTSPSEAVDTIEKALEGVDEVRWGQGEFMTDMVLDGSHPPSNPCSVVCEEQNSDIAAYIAACSPDRMREVLSLARKAEAMEREMAKKDVQIERLEADLEEARDVPWPDWANTVLKTLQHYGYDPVVDGEVDLGESFKDYLAGVGQAEEEERKKLAEKDARIAALEKAITSPFSVVYLDGRNEHGTHVLPVLPTSINEEADDIADQAEAIMAAAEAEGFSVGDIVWAEFVNVPPQVGDEGRIELAGYWEFKRVNTDMSRMIGSRALIGGDNAQG